MDNATANLLIDQHGVDHCAAVFYAPMLKKFDKTRLGIYFHIRRLNAVGECKAVFTGCVMTSHREFGLEIHGQSVGSKVSNASHFTDGHMFCASELIDHYTID